MENTKHNLYTESLSAKINRLEQTVRELKNLNDKLIRGQEIDKRAYEQATSIRDKKIENLNNTVAELLQTREEVDTLQDYILQIKQNEAKQKNEIKSLTNEVEYYKSLTLKLNK